MDDFGDEDLSTKKQIKTNDSKKKIVKSDKINTEPLKASPKRKNPPKKNNKKAPQQKSEKKKLPNEENEAEILCSDKESDQSFASPSKKNTKQKPQFKKKKEDPSTTLVLEYMKKQNRPYSLINILDNLHGEIKKTQGQKILDQLSEEGELQMKEYGKARIYLINQKNIPLVDPKEMDNLKALLDEKKNDHGALANEIKLLKKKETDLNNQLSNEQLAEEIEKYVDLLKESDDKIEYYKSPNYVKIPDNVINEAEAIKNKIEKEYKKRRRFCIDMINQLSEGMEKKPKEIEEMIGIERD